MTFAAKEVEECNGAERGRVPVRPLTPACTLVQDESEYTSYGCPSGRLEPICVGSGSTVADITECSPYHYHGRHSIQSESIQLSQGVLVRRLTTYLGNFHPSQHKRKLEAQILRRIRQSIALMSFVTIICAAIFFTIFNWMYGIFFVVMGGMLPMLCWNHEKLLPRSSHPGDNGARSQQTSFQQASLQSVKLILLSISSASLAVLLVFIWLLFLLALYFHSDDLPNLLYISECDGTIPHKTKIPCRVTRILHHILLSLLPILAFGYSYSSYKGFQYIRMTDNHLIPS